MEETHAQVEARAVKVCAILNHTYGERTLKPRANPLRVLIATVLSQRTTARGERKAFEAMWARYGSWPAIRDAPTEELAETLKPANYSTTKAKRIQAILEILLSEKDQADLRFLRDLSADEGLKVLTSLPGVGLKTASVVLLFNFAKPVQPVDTHVHRISQRLDFVGKNADKAHHTLRELYPPDANLHYSLHVAMIRHGRRICKSQAPGCECCPLLDLCPHGLEVTQ